MSRPLRLEFPGALFHVTSRGNRKQNIFLDDTDREHFLKLLGEGVERFAWSMLAYVLMGNHFHLLIQLTRETLSKGMQWLNGSYVQAFNRRHRCVGHLFQGRPDAPLIDQDAYLLEVLRYVVLNPVRAGFVERPQDYVWSSYRAAVGLATPQKWLAVDDVLVNFGTDRRLARAAYQEFVEDAVGLHTNPWKNLVGQIYLGSETWLDEIGERIKLKPRSDDHPRTQRLVGQPSMVEVIAAVAKTFSSDKHCIQERGSGVPRMAAAWIACNSFQLTNREIAAGLRLRSSGHVTEIIRRFDREIDRNPVLRVYIDHAVATLCRDDREPKL